MSVSINTFLPTGRLSSGVRSKDGPFFHFTYGIGDPTATQVKFKEAPSITSLTAGGGMEKLGATRRTAIVVIENQRNTERKLSFVLFSFWFGKRMRGGEGEGGEDEFRIGREGSTIPCQLTTRIRLEKQTVGSRAFDYAILESRGTSTEAVSRPPQEMPRHNICDAISSARILCAVSLV